MLEPCPLRTAASGNRMFPRRPQIPASAAGILYTITAPRTGAERSFYAAGRSLYPAQLYQALCDDLDTDEQILAETLERIGVRYDAEQNRFL